MTRWTHGDPNAIVKQILAQRDYRSAPATSQQSPVLRFWYEFWQFVGRLIKPLFDWLNRALGSGHGPAQVLSVALVLVTVLALAFLIYRIAVAFARPVMEARRNVVGSISDSHDAGAWQALAAERAAAGDFARAIAALFSAALALLDDAGIVAFDAARTPNEYRLLVRRERTSAAPPFDALSDRFVRATFAEATPLRADFDAAALAFGRLQPLLAPL